MVRVKVSTKIYSRDQISGHLTLRAAQDGKDLTPSPPQFTPQSFIFPHPFQLVPSSPSSSPLPPLPPPSTLRENHIKLPSSPQLSKNSFLPPRMAPKNPKEPVDPPVQSSSQESKVTRVYIRPREGREKHPTATTQLDKIRFFLGHCETRAA
ncbi:hypothetical protein TWF225_009787 [Orbilia oligospora]|nr:hypothetical protein TWF751_006625 [Orbilia oligospora]KAF3173511.1 hypothetical protein TWF225_009787 [Orbilia oligospora]KAF3246709.1 hypothetical protein TWF128_008827 [Orbilia oligospora]KAF3257832.1 hypothetical protein TWF217_005936 [Orbilia oligospora]KAF3278051.1 hypothetical protein TWF132_001308 [Orbilia oligospora]